LRIVEAPLTLDGYMPARTARAAAVLFALVATAIGCGRSPTEAESPITIYGVADILFELDSAQLSVGTSRPEPIPAEAVTWSVDRADFASVSPTGLLRAIRATDFDRPADVFRTSVTVSATVGNRRAFRTVDIDGWRKPFSTEAGNLAYMPGSSFFGTDEAGQHFSGTGMLILACGTAAPGKWTVEISPYHPENPRADQTRKLFGGDTVFVTAGKAARYERWERVGVRLRAADGDAMVREMRQDHSITVVARSYSATELLTFTFRLGNVDGVTQAVVFAACD
jgi:hypothetical protein